jgi:hypothetical protein
MKSKVNLQQYFSGINFIQEIFMGKDYWRSFLQGVKIIHQEVNLIRPDGIVDLIEPGRRRQDDRSERRFLS